MANETFFHIGVLVRDLDAAIKKFSDALGISFRTPQVMDFSAFGEQPPAKTGPLHFVYSVDGPPYIELLEATGTGAFSASQPEGLHHIGRWGDCGDQQEHLRGLAIGTQGRLLGPDGKAHVLLTDPADLYGIRVEYLDSQNRTGFESFLASGL